MSDVGRVCGGDACEEGAGNDTIAAKNSVQYKTHAGDEDNNNLGGVDIVNLLKLMSRDSQYVDSIKFDKILNTILLDHV